MSDIYTYEIQAYPITISFYYKNHEYTIEIDSSYRIKYRTWQKEEVVNRINVLKRGSMYAWQYPQDARVTNEYLAIYNWHEIISTKIRYLFKSHKRSLSSWTYKISKEIDKKGWQEIYIVDLVHIDNDLIAAGLEDIRNNQVAVAFIDLESGAVRHTGKFGSDIRLVRLAKYDDNKVMALCDHRVGPFREYTPHLEIHGGLEIYTVDVESAIVVSKKVVD
jgi:hypothetical protein